MEDLKKFETAPDEKTDWLQVRITPDEKQLFAQEAQRLGISMSAFTRLLLRVWRGEIEFKRST